MRTKRPLREPVRDAPGPTLKNYITPAGLQRLKDEHRFLLHKERPAVTQVVAWAAGNGDRSENADYQYGKRRLREIDRRIRFLTKRIDAAAAGAINATRAAGGAVWAVGTTTLRTLESVVRDDGTVVVLLDVELGCVPLPVDELQHVGVTTVELVLDGKDLVDDEDLEFALVDPTAEAPGEDWSLARMAAVAHVTPRHLTRLFQLHAGMSPRQHVEQVRLALAREAHVSGMTRERAADLAGFSSTRQ